MLLVSVVGLRRVTFVALGSMCVYVGHMLFLYIVEIDEIRTATEASFDAMENIFARIKAESDRLVCVWRASKIYVLAFVFLFVDTR